MHLVILKYFPIIKLKYILFVEMKQVLLRQFHSGLRLTHL